MNDIISSLKPKYIFLLGLGSAVLLLCTIGFFVMLGVVLGGDDDKTPSYAKQGENVRPSAPQPSVKGAKIVLSDDDWYKGDKDAKITVVEFSDLECPFCKRFHSTMDQIVKEYNGKVKWVYRHFPLTSLHSKAVKEAEATECAGELGGNDGFWAFTDRLIEITPSNNGLQLDQLGEIAEYVGLNRSKFQACLDSGKYEEKVKAQAQQAQAAGGQGTPFSIVVTEDQQIPLSGAQPVSSVKATIDSLL